MITEDLAALWPLVALRLARMLRRRGVRCHDADEIVQETAARVVSTQVPFTDEDDLFRWASVVGWRLAIDQRRRQARVADHEIPDGPDGTDVAAAAEHRIVLDAVRDRFGQLSTRDRQALLSGFEPLHHESRTEAVRLAVARHRARTRLRAMLEGLAAPVLGLWARRIRPWTPRADAIAFGSAPAVACLAITIGLVTGVPYTTPFGTAVDITLAELSPHQWSRDQWSQPRSPRGRRRSRLPRPWST